ncbi:hypothetical protein QSV34_14635 [Porticoccus sp. W117]|uniref:hypothetical protein n=1 Tax=Porticoccus sp. W117 TaxID=3054777 RepID=UPI0025972E1A|nr:hypothetical protein [Porticoccus sp. W117]MDM3872587.1 hypothetical protein [Porticoccus sp. W117]
MSNSQALINNKVDFWLVGGLSLLGLCVLWTFTDLFSKVDFWYTAWLLAFFVNGPHFLISYLMFYRLHSEQLQKRSVFKLVGFALPAVICALCIAAFFLKSAVLLIGLLYSMFFLVGWHYVRQGYGVLMVMSGINHSFFSAWEQRLVKWSLYALWGASFLSMFGLQERFTNYWGLSYSIPSLNPLWVQMAQILAYGGLVAILLLLAYRHWVAGIRDSLSGVTGVLVQYVWMLPLFKHPQFFLFVPLFHSLQYLIFPAAVIQNREESQGVEGIEKRIWLHWWGPAFVLAALAFYFVPDALDRVFWESHKEVFGGSFFLVSFIVFINIHHYFIDSLMWKRENEVVRNYLKPVGSSNKADKECSI